MNSSKYSQNFHHVITKSKEPTGNNQQNNFYILFLFYIGKKISELTKTFYFISLGKTKTLQSHIEGTRPSHHLIKTEKRERQGKWSMPASKAKSLSSLFRSAGKIVSSTHADDVALKHYVSSLDTSSTSSFTLIDRSIKLPKQPSAHSSKPLSHLAVERFKLHDSAASDSGITWYLLVSVYLYSVSLCLWPSKWEIHYYFKSYYILFYFLCRWINKATIEGDICHIVWYVCCFVSWVENYILIKLRSN